MFLSINKIFWFPYKNTRRFTFSGSKQFRLFYKNIKMFHKKDVVCKIITTESVIAPKLVFFFVEKCYTDAIYLYFSTPLRGFINNIFFVKSQLPYPLSIIVKSSSGAHFLRWRSLETRNVYLIFFTTLRGFFHGNFLGGHTYRTHHSADLIRHSFFCYQIRSKSNLFIFFLRLL